MIKPITYQAQKNFTANLYAVELRSRFADQFNASGYYKNYGEDLAAISAGKIITIKSGAFLVQGRMNEIVGEESIEVSASTNGLKGYICARIETYHVDDLDNCKLVAYTGSSLDSIVLTKEDVYARASETSNRIYELPLYSFEIVNGAVSNLKKVIRVIDDYTTFKAIADETKQIASSSDSKSDSALLAASTAQQKANEAATSASAASNSASAALEQARTSANAANEAAISATKCQEAVDQVVEAGGTQVLIDGVKQATYEAKNNIQSTDTLYLDGGGA